MGVEIAGTDYTSQIIGQGLYRVNIDANEFTTPPIVIVTVDTTRENETYTACAAVKDVTPDGFTVSVSNMDNRLIPFGFHFICLRA